MQKWCPEPFAVPGEPGTPAAAIVFRSVSGTDAAAATGVDGDGESLQFRRETGYADPRSLLATLTRQERSDLFELAEADVAGAYEARLAEQAAEFAARLDEARREAAATLAAWTSGLETVFREDLNRAASAAASLALQVAGKIVRDTVAVDHGVLTRALETILYKQRAAAPLHVFVSPADAVWLAEQADLRARLNIETIADDRRLQDGDCRVRSDGREWDLTLDGQLATLGEIVAETLSTRRQAAPAAEGGSPDEHRLG